MQDFEEIIFFFYKKSRCFAHYVTKMAQHLHISEKSSNFADGKECYE